MIAFALVAAGTTLAVGLVAALLLRRLPSLRLQLVALVLLALALPLAAVLVSGVVMFTSGHDLTVLAVAGPPRRPRSLPPSFSPTRFTGRSSRFVGRPSPWQAVTSRLARRRMARRRSPSWRLR